MVPTITTPDVIIQQVTAVSHANIISNVAAAINTTTDSSIRNALAVMIITSVYSFS